MKITSTAADYDIEQAFIEIGEPEYGIVSIIRLLRAHPSEIVAYGWKSHVTLGLLSEDRHDTPWWIKVDRIPMPPPHTIFRVQALIPERIAPWPNAYAVGEAETPEKAVELIIAGMKYSEGWKQ